MGVIYKLKAEIKDFILEKKKADPNLSCRKFSALILEQFQAQVSKSSINLVFKEAGLSLPVGRRRKKRRRRPEIIAKPAEEIKLIAAPIEVPTELLVGPEIKAEAPIEAEARREEDVSKAEEQRAAEEEERIARETALKAEREKWARLAEEERKAKEAAEKPPEAPVEAKVEAPAETEATGIILLKSADSLVGGTYYINEAIKGQLKSSGLELLSKIEALLYGSSDMSSFLNELQEVRALPFAIFRIISSVFQEVRYVKVNLSDADSFYLDGQLHTVWSTPQLPCDFSTTIYNIKSYINKYFKESKPFVLFMAPGYETPTKEFFDFISGLESEEKQISNLTLYGNKFEEIEVIPVETAKRRSFVFGLWPWQFGQFRRVIKAIGEFKPFNFEPLKKDFYLADVDIELSQPTVNRSVTLKGCVLKTSLNEKIRLVILSNLGFEGAKEELAGLYLSHWPNLEEAFQDFSRKIELFTYTANSQHFFSLESLGFDRENSSDIKALFDYYLKALDLYVRWHFLPAGYENKDFPTINEHFYSLKAQVKQEKNNLQTTFQPASGYPYLKDLAYACRRVNEKEVIFPDGKQLWLAV